MIPIGFDARMIRHSGIGTYSRGILKRLTQNPEFDFTLFGNLDKIAEYDSKKVLADFPIYSIREQFSFPVLLAAHKIPILHVPHYNASLGYGGKLIVTVHDLIHLKFPPSRPAYFYARTMIEAVTRKAKIVLTVSQNTRRDLIEILGTPEKKIRVVYPGVNAPNNNIRGQAPAPNPAAAASGAQRDPYLLYVGNVRPTKNIRTLVEAFLSAQKDAKDLRLVLAGKESTPEYSAQFKDRPGIEFLGEVAERDLQGLYLGARVFVFPSLYEGFGLPPLEAMSLGVPVICSNAASLPEAVGDAALTFDPKDAGALADAIKTLWKSDGERQRLISKGFEQVKKFSWNQCAQETSRAYQEIA